MVWPDAFLGWVWPESLVLINAAGLVSIGRLMVSMQLQATVVGPLHVTLAAGIVARANWLVAARRYRLDRHLGEASVEVRVTVTTVQTVGRFDGR